MATTRIRPTAGKVQERDIVTVIIGGAADINAVKIATELEAASSLAIECFLRDFNPEGSEGTSTATPRYCDGGTFPSRGKVEWSPLELNYIYRPSEATESDNNKAFATLQPGLIVDVVNRPDYPKELPPAAGQFYNGYRVELGAQIPSRSADATEANAEWQIKQMAYIQSDPALHKTFLA